MKHIIVGAGPAGIVAAETLRKNDASADIHVIGGEPEPPYSRMAIPYFLEKNISEEGTYLRKDIDHYKGMAINYTHGKVESLAPKENSIVLEGGDNVTYDKLLLATGARPISLPIPGVELPGVYNCWTLDDARKISKLAKEGSDVVLVGAGFIGCIILESLLKLAGSLTVVEMEERMVSRMMDHAAGDMLKRWCESKEVNVLTSNQVKSISEGASGTSKKVVTLGNGKTLDADLVVLAAGVTSNKEFVDGSGINTDSGILVDWRMATSVKDIYAAGDVAQGPDFTTGEHEVHAIQPTAVEHGRVAALNMLGRDPGYKGSLNMNVLATAGLISSSFGKWDGVKGGGTAISLDEAKYRYLRLEFDSEDHVIGALGIGMTEHVGVLRGLILNRTPLGKWKDKLLASPNRVMEAFVANSQV